MPPPLSPFDFDESLQKKTRRESKLSSGVQRGCWASLAHGFYLHNGGVWVAATVEEH
jgi:hypothetical protein